MGSADVKNPVDDRDHLISIRPAIASDAPAIARLHVDSWRSTYCGIVPDAVLDSLDADERAETWRNQILDSTRNGFVLVAEDPDRAIVGFVSGGSERTGDYPGYTGEVYAIYLDDVWQGCGIGRDLIRAGARCLNAQGHQSMLILALTQNPACGFYRRLGGVTIARQQIQMARTSLEEMAFGWKNIAVLLDQ